MLSCCGAQAFVRGEREGAWSPAQWRAAVQQEAGLCDGAMARRRQKPRRLWGSPVVILHTAVRRKCSRSLFCWLNCELPVPLVGLYLALSHMSSKSGDGDGGAARAACLQLAACCLPRSLA
eukprot:scaffold12209_cov134-Isochrysis_galbana.AAC.2